MIVFFWFGLTWVIYVYVGYPLIVAALRVVRKVRPNARDAFLPKVSVLIAARNEEKDIEWKIRETLSWDYPPDRLELLVASDMSEDSTDEIVLGINDPRLFFLRLEKRGGKNVALNALVERASGELLFFTDANSHIGKDCLQRIVRHFADLRVGCVTGEMLYDSGEADDASATGERAYWGYESLIKSVESAIGSVLVCVGSVFCIRRSLFAPLHPELANDLELPMRIGGANRWILYEKQACSIEKISHSPREEYARRRRICAQGMLGMWRLQDQLRGLRGWQFLSRKFLRWLGVVPLGLLMISSVVLMNRPFFAALAALQLIFYGLALAGWVLVSCSRPVPRAAWIPFFILLVNVAALVGVVEACRGRRFATWEIATLSRGREGITL